MQNAVKKKFKPTAVLPARGYLSLSQIAGGKIIPYTDSHIRVLWKKTATGELNQFDGFPVPEQFGGHNVWNAIDLKAWLDHHDLPTLHPVQADCDHEVQS